MQTIAIFDTIHFGLRKGRPIFQADFINIHVTNVRTLVKRVNLESNSFVNHTTPLCLQNMHMLYLRLKRSTNVADHLATCENSRKFTKMVPAFVQHLCVGALEIWTTLAFENYTN